MTDHRVIVLVAAAAWGALLGLFYFGGLWWTLKSAPRRSSPRAFLFLSFGVRTSLVLLGFWLVLPKGVPFFFVTVAAFFLTRFAVTRKVGAGKGDKKHAG